ncbi:hypothetical protein SBY92_005447 [Candida maltosa Xu316]|uniref:Mitochondrial outer membrane protein OM14 C-terminal domain-containing protein n=1 Tax=Candida maltosa (strain Xu316) TaxID=1245528 RepID=M3IJS5_CANMX|nr:hypothetical protein G210_3117 [Candida maltosa Xu316]
MSAPSIDQLKKKDADSIEKIVAEEAGKLQQQGEEELEQANAKGREFLEEANEKGKEFLKEAKKELNHLEEEGKDLLSKLVAWVKSTATCVGETLTKVSSDAQVATSNAVSKTAVELQNPVVVAQVAVVAGGIGAGYLAYLEKHRINTDNKYVVGIHASIITGLVLLDGYLFTTYYPKYDKKAAK